MKCKALTKSHKFCKNEAKFLFCSQHRFFPLWLFFIVVSFIGSVFGILGYFNFTGIVTNGKYNDTLAQRSPALLKNDGNPNPNQIKLSLESKTTITKKQLILKDSLKSKSNPPGNVTINAPVGGSVINNQGQIGGQVAHQIINIGPPSRVLSPAAMRLLTDIVKAHPQQSFEISYIYNDKEANNLAYQIASALEKGGWKCTAMAAAAIGIPVLDMEIGAPEETQVIKNILEWGHKAGLKPRSSYSKELKQVTIMIGSLE
ncbi:MAG: hypothetical protein V1799_15310 [bacterium]